MTDEQNLGAFGRRVAGGLGKALSDLPRHAFPPGTPLPRAMWVQDNEIDEWLAGWRVAKTLDGTWQAGCPDSGAQVRASSFLALVEAVRKRKGEPL